MRAKPPPGLTTSGTGALPDRFASGGHPAGARQRVTGTASGPISASRAAFAFVATGLVVVLGCSRPQASVDNLHLITSLRTAASTRNPEWLSQNAELVEQRRAAGQMTDAEYATFQRIIELARDGKWQAAEREAVLFQKAQRPTPEQIERVRTRTREKSHRHE
jgi:hypothetical protein